MPGTLIEPYLFFNGRCEEAFNFYAKALGARIERAVRYSESPEKPKGMQPGMEAKIMHASMVVGGARVMGSDGCFGAETKFDGFSLSLASASRGDVEKWFAALSQGGKVTMPLSTTFWSPLFGMVTDKFGVGWMVSVVHDLPK